MNTFKLVSSIEEETNIYNHKYEGDITLLTHYGDKFIRPAVIDVYNCSPKAIDTITNLDYHDINKIYFELIKDHSNTDVNTLNVRIKLDESCIGIIKDDDLNATPIVFSIGDLDILIDADNIITHNDEFNKMIVAEVEPYPYLRYNEGIYLFTYHGDPRTYNVDTYTYRVRLFIVDSHVAKLGYGLFPTSDYLRKISEVEV